MENELKGQLHSIYTTYSAIKFQLSRIEEETNRLVNERSTLSEILDNTRELEKSVINNLEQILGKTLSVDDIIEIIKAYD
jgi:regulator of replication initiation timing